MKLRQGDTPELYTLGKLVGEPDGLLRLTTLQAETLEPRADTVEERLPLVFLPHYEYTGALVTILVAYPH